MSCAVSSCFVTNQAPVTHFDRFVSSRASSSPRFSLRSVCFFSPMSALPLNPVEEFFVPNRASSKTNSLLVHPEVGTVRRSTMSLPPTGHTYGRKNPIDPENAGAGLKFTCNKLNHENHPFSKIHGSWEDFGKPDCSGSFCFPFACATTQSFSTGNRTCRTPKHRRRAISFA